MMKKTKKFSKIHMTYMSVHISMHTVQAYSAVYRGI